MKKMTNIVYKVFHSDKDVDREQLWREANHKLQHIGDELDTPTVLISGRRALKKFFDETTQSAQLTTPSVEREFKKQVKIVKYREVF